MLLSVSDGLKKTLRVVSPHFSNETIYLPYDNNLENPMFHPCRICRTMTTLKNKYSIRSEEKLIALLSGANLQILPI